MVDLTFVKLRLLNLKYFALYANLLVTIATMLEFVSENNLIKICFGAPGRHSKSSLFARHPKKQI